jgi:hypothetical protein
MKLWSNDQIKKTEVAWIYGANSNIKGKSTELWASKKTIKTTQICGENNKNESKIVSK